MKVAIIHDMFPTFGGSERVVFEFSSLYPNADIYTLLYNYRDPVLSEFGRKHHIFTSLLQRLVDIIPNSKLQYIARVFSNFYWESLNLNQYHLVISSTYKYNAKAVITTPHCFHLSYIHSTPKDLYQESSHPTIKARNMFQSFLGSFLFPNLRIQDFIGVQRPDILVANSQYTQEQVKKLYRRPSILLHPPVFVPKGTPLFLSKNREYYLSFSRLDREKGVDIIIRAFNRLEEKLVVVGAGNESDYLKSIAGPNVSFLGFVPDHRLPHIFSHAIASICCSLNEDFGMALVEAMAYGVPAIAHNSGGFRESIRPGKTGLLYEDLSPDGVIQAIDELKRLKISPDECMKQAKKFSRENFARRFINLVKTSMR